MLTMKPAAITKSRWKAFGAGDLVVAEGVQRMREGAPVELIETRQAQVTSPVAAWPSGDAVQEADAQ